MRADRKPPRRMIVRAVIYKAMRAYIKAQLDIAAARYGTGEYESARFRETCSWGEIRGAMKAASSLGVPGFYEGRIEQRLKRVEAALKKRCEAVREEKYASIRGAP